VTGIDTAGTTRGSVTCSSRETAVGINLDSAGLYSEIPKRHAATQEHPNISIYFLQLNIIAVVFMYYVHRAHFT
jgi:hypothetical protein